MPPKPSEKVEEHHHKPHHAHEEHVSYDEEPMYEVKTLLAWHAPSRPHRARSKEFYINSLLILAALEVILFLFDQKMLMLVVFSVAFLTYALSTTPPEAMYYRISTEGVAVGDHFYLWQELYDFYFKQREGVEVLHIRTKAYLPGELVLPLGEVPKDQVKHLLVAFLPYREIVRSTFTERAGEWMSRSFPLERNKSSHHTT